MSQKCDIKFISRCTIFFNRSFKTNFIVQQAVGAAFHVHVKQTAADQDRSESEINETNETRLSLD